MLCSLRQPNHELQDNLKCTKNEEKHQESRAFCHFFSFFSSPLLRVTNLIEAYETEFVSSSLCFFSLFLFHLPKRSLFPKTFHYCIELLEKDMQARYAHYVNKILIRLKAEQCNSNFRGGRKT